MNLAATLSLSIACLCCGSSPAQTWPATIESRQMAGVAIGDNFGTAACMVGDVNGDGFNDWAVSAPYADPNGSASGAVYVYFGAPEFCDTAPDLILAGEAANDHFGISVSGGDLDGDGFSEIIVGARLSDRGAGDAGAVFIFRGGVNPSSSPSKVLAGESADDWFGQSVSYAGDVNGDGFGDMLAGAPYNDASASAAGRAYLYFGGTPLPAAGVLALNGPAQANAHFGWSVAGGGDINGDGRNDILVGARLFGTGPNRARGRAYLYLGATSMNTTPDLTLDGQAADDWFGQTVAGLGDVNGDGKDDFAVGAIYNDAGGSAAGSTSVFLGNVILPTLPAVRILGTDADAQGGNAIAGGDLNGDGLADIIVGAHFADTVALPAAGAVLVLMGSQIPHAEPDYALFGMAAGDHFGESVTGSAPVAVGLPAWIVGANFNDLNGDGSGTAWVVRIRNCAADFNGDQTVDFFDYLDFVDAFAGTLPIADFNHDGIVDFFDYLDFVDVLSTGC